MQSIGAACCCNPELHPTIGGWPFTLTTRCRRHSPQDDALEADSERDPRFEKVRLLQRALSSHHAPAVRRVLWIDADAVLLGVHHPAARPPQTTEATDIIAAAMSWPGAADAELVLCYDATAASDASLTNTGVMLASRSEWTDSFLQAWWDHPGRLQGATPLYAEHAPPRSTLTRRVSNGGGGAAGWTDQAVLEQLLRADVLGARSQRRVLLLPTVAFNTEAPFYEAFHNRRRPAVLHLMGACPRARCLCPTREALNEASF